MIFADSQVNAKSYWLVGAVINDIDQVDTFIAEGIWENGYSDKYLDKLKSVAVGDRIAIKAAYTQKQGLPFADKSNKPRSLCMER